MPEWRVREIARESAKEAVKDFCERVGIEDVSKTRRSLDYLSMQISAAEGRRNEGRKTAFAIIGGIVMSVLGYVFAVFSKGHSP